MQTRYGRGYRSYFVSVAWPLTHAVFIILAYIAVNHLAPLGDDPIIFVATGVLPYILCLYPGRSMPLLFVLNKALLAMPAIKPIHLIAAGLVIELLTACIVAMLICAILMLAGAEIIPTKLETAALALGATLYLGLGIGVLNVTLISVFGNFYLTFYIVFMVGVYIGSGIIVPPWLMPQGILEILQYNPLLNLVDWIRSAYYVNFNSGPIDTILITGTATVALLLGLLGERFLRNKFYSM